MAENFTHRVQSHDSNCVHAKGVPEGVSACCAQLDHFVRRELVSVADVVECLLDHAGKGAGCISRLCFALAGSCPWPQDRAEQVNGGAG